MKAACVLLCLALGASANLFKRSHRDPKNIIVPQEYINQYQRPLYRPQEQTYQEYIRAQKQQQQSESSQSSSQETRIPDDVTYPRPAARDWRAPLYSVMPQRESARPAYAEAIVWRGLDKAVDADAPLQRQIQMIYADAQKAMKHPTEEEKTSFHNAYEIAAEKNDEDAHLNATELLKKHGYPVEEHTVKTDDGYFLTVFRIPAKKLIRDVTAKPVAFLMHGVLGSADDWLLMGPGRSLAYLLADAGYEVWLGNARGNKYSRRHVTKHPALGEFWQFSNDEVALHDLPAMIDYALKTSGQERLHYVGHAQGTTAFFALTAARPIYNEKIISMHALAPMAYMKHVRSPLIRMVAPSSPFRARLHRLVGRSAFQPTAELISAVGGDMCVAEIGCPNVCSNVNFVMSGVSIENMDAETAAVIVGHLPAGGSAKTIEQYAQGAASGEFTKYDYGAVINNQVYGTMQPPKYNMSRVTAPVALYSAAEDWLSHPADVARLHSELPHSEVYEVPEPHFSHMDFQFSTKAPELVYKKLIDSMNTY